MKKREPKCVETRAASSRERIIDAATRLFAERGFEAMTMRMLGEAVGLDNSSLYRHFASKSEIANVVFDKVAGELLAEIAPLIDASRPASLDVLVEIAVQSGRHLYDRPHHARIAAHWLLSTGGDGGSGFRVSVPLSDKTRPSGRLMDALRDWLARGVRRGTLRKHAMPEAIIILMGAILIRPATYGHLLESLEPRRSRKAAIDAWEAELRAVVRGAFAP